MSATSSPQIYQRNPLKRAATEVPEFEEAEGSTSTQASTAGRPFKRHRTDTDLFKASRSNEKHDDEALPYDNLPIPGPTDPNNDLIWLDLETDNALTKYEDMTILEVAVLVTDRYLVPRDKGIHFVISWDKVKVQKLFAEMIPKVREMHFRSGLLTELKVPSLSRPQYNLISAEDMIIAYLEKHNIERDGTLAGCGVAYDRNVIKYHMPRLHEKLRYQVFDVSSVWQLVKRNYNIRNRSDPKVKTAHRAMRDVHYAINEAKMFRDVIFKGVKDVQWPY